MIIWLRRHTPTWLLKYLGWRNYRLALAGHPRSLFSSWADLELFSRYDHRLDWDCSCDHTIGENCEECNPND